MLYKKSDKWKERYTGWICAATNMEIISLENTIELRIWTSKSQHLKWTFKQHYMKYGYNCPEMSIQVRAHMQACPTSPQHPHTHTESHITNLRIHRRWILESEIDQEDSGHNIIEKPTCLKQSNKPSNQYINSKLNICKNNSLPDCRFFNDFLWRSTASFISNKCL